MTVRHENSPQRPMVEGVRGRDLDDLLDDLAPAPASCAAARAPGRGLGIEEARPRSSTGILAGQKGANLAPRCDFMHDLGAERVPPRASCASLAGPAASGAAVARPAELPGGPHGAGTFKAMRDFLRRGKTRAGQAKRRKGRGGAKRGAKRLTPCQERAGGDLDRDLDLDHDDRGGALAALAPGEGWQPPKAPALTMYGFAPAGNPSWQCTDFAPYERREG